MEPCCLLAFFPGLCSAYSLIQTRITCPWGAPPTVDLAFPHLSVIKKMPHGHIHRSGRKRKFPSWGRLPGCVKVTAEAVQQCVIVFIVNWTWNHLETYLWAFLCACFQGGLAAEARLTLNVGSAILWAGVPRWTKWEGAKQAENQPPSLRSRRQTPCCLWSSRLPSTMEASPLKAQSKLNSSSFLLLGDLS